MKRAIPLVLMLTLMFSLGCSKTVLVPVPPRLDLKTYGTVGIIEFKSNADPALNTYATQQFQEVVHGAAPGTPILELGSREAVLAAVGSSDFDPETLTKIGKKFNVAAVFIGDITYSDPKTDIRVTDISTLDGGIRTEVRGDFSTKLLETRSGASVWSSSSWARRQIGNLNVSTRRGVSATMGDTNPRKEMVPALIQHATNDFRPTYVRQKVE